MFHLVFWKKYLYMSPALASGTWHHFAVTWHEAQVILYLDGKPFITGTDTASPRKAMGVTTIGGVATNGSPGTRADCVFDEFALWDHERGWTQQFHFRALRNTNARRLGELGYRVIEASEPAEALLAVQGQGSDSFAAPPRFAGQE